MLDAGQLSSRFRDARIPFLVARLSTCGECLPHVRDAARLHCAVSRGGDIDGRSRIRAIHAAHGDNRVLLPARRYWQLADSDDAVATRGALSTAAVREVTERSDEHIEGQTFDACDGP